MGVSFSGQGGLSQGVLVTAAIGAHNIPEGMAVATVLVQKGTSPARAVLWAIATSLPQPLLAVPSYIFVETFQVPPHLLDFRMKSSLDLTPTPPPPNSPI